MRSKHRTKHLFPTFFKNKSYILFNLIESYYHIITCASNFLNEQVKIYCTKTKDSKTVSSKLPCASDSRVAVNSANYMPTQLRASIIKQSTFFLWIMKRDFSEGISFKLYARGASLTYNLILTSACASIRNYCRLLLRLTFCLI